MLEPRTRTTRLLLAGLLACAAIAPGCGSSGGSAPSDASRQPCGTALPDGSRAYSVRVPPKYPSEARGRSGRVSLMVNLDRTGRPTSVSVVESQPPGVFDDAAVNAVRQWRYCPPRGPSEGFRVELEFAP